MKRNILLLCIALISVFSYAQEKKHNFDKKLVYKFKSEVSEGDPELVLNNYYSPTTKTNLFETISNNTYSNSKYVIVSHGKYLRIDGLTLDRELLSFKESSMSYAFEESKSFTESLSTPLVFTKMNKKGSFNGINCEYYQISTPNTTEDSTENTFLGSTCMCIDTQNKLKNLKSIFPQANIDGLVVAFSDIESEKNMVYLDQIASSNLQLTFDFDKIYSEKEKLYQQYLDEIQESYGAADSVYAATEAYPSFEMDPLCDGYSYLKDLESNANSFAINLSNLICVSSTSDSDWDGVPDLERKKVISLGEKQVRVSLKEAKKNKLFTKEEIKALETSFKNYFSAAKNYDPEKHIEDSDVVVDSAAYAVPESAFSDVENRKYTSVYKDMKIEDINLAAELQLDYGILPYMPSYCEDLKNKIPNFSNTNLTKHVHNLVGQLCDLYLYQNGGSVDYFGTIDSFRKSLLEIENMREKLSKKDAKLLTEFLNSLD